jgi:hypothetical protein
MQLDAEIRVLDQRPTINNTASQLRGTQLFEVQAHYHHKRSSSHHGPKIILSQTFVIYGETIIRYLSSKEEVEGRG